MRLNSQSFCYAYNSFFNLKIALFSFGVPTCLVCYCNLKINNKENREELKRLVFTSEVILQQLTSNYSSFFSNLKETSIESDVPYFFRLSSMNTYIDITLCMC